MNAPAPDAIGAYRIRGRLGSGGMGEVFLAFDERLGRHVAIKRLRPDVESVSNRRRLRREARAAAGLNHPAIVQIHDILEDDSGDSIVMEHVEGSSLHRILARDGVTAADAVDLARQVAEGLAAAHGRGIVHRDLKAENVMVTPDGRAKILDFGLAKPPPFTDPDAALTQEGAVLGTLRTMSPEQAAGRPADARSDLYSLGVLLYEMVTGRTPFEGGGLAYLHQQVLTARPVPPFHLRPELPSELSSLTESLLEKDPDRRPQSAREVASRLAEIAGSPDLAALGARSRSAAREASPMAASDAPTMVSPPVATAAEPGSPEPPSPEASAGGERSRDSAQPATRKPIVRRGLIAACSIALVAVAALLLMPEAAPLRVVVLTPEVQGGDDTTLAALAVREAAVGTLLALEGLEIPDSSEVGEGPRTVSEVARAAAADEVIATTVELRDKTLWITMRRVDGRDARMIWSSGAFEVPNLQRVSHELNDAVGSRLRKAYPDRRLRPGFPELEVREQDYTAFLQLQKEIRAGRELGEKELEELEVMMRSSPRFLAGYLLAADVSRTLGQLDRARSLLDRASGLAPGDPRAYFQRAVLEIGASRHSAAEEAILEMESRAPGDLKVDYLRARLLEDRGRLREAVETWREIVGVRPSWRHLYQLGRVESRLGEIEAARGHFGRLLEVSPRNPQGLSELARLELRYGDLEAADRLFRDLIGLRRQRSDYINLGTVLFLRREYPASAEAFRQALEIAPGHVLARLNLADAELAAGRTEVARGLYQDIAHELRDQEGAQGADAFLSMVLAQCLVRLGDARRAVEITQRTLSRHSEDADVNFQAAVVYALAGERHSALASAEEALALGFQRRWFEIPELETVRSELDLRDSSTR